MKTAELTGALLNYWVARAEGVPAEQLLFYETPYTKEKVCAHWAPGAKGVSLHYSTDWAQGGPLIQKWHLDLQECNGPVWEVYRYAARTFTQGDTPLQAICRAVVRAAFGDEVGEVDLG